MGVEWEDAGEGMWWPGPLSLVITGDSVFTVLDDDGAGASCVLCVFMPLYPFVRAAAEGTSLL